MSGTTMTDAPYGEERQRQGGDMAVDVVGVGLAVVDLKATVSSIPKEEETVLAFDYHKHHGGPVGNALVTLHRLSDGDSTPFSIVLVDATTKKRSIVFNPGCALMTPADAIDAGAVKSAKLLHVDIYTPAVTAACEAAKSAGLPISVDADALFPGLEEILELADIFIPAREIACELVGKQDPVLAAERLLRKYRLKVVGVTRGREGSVTITQEGTVSAPGFEIDAVDTTGAGGVYQGAFLYGYLKGWPTNQIARFANAAAALMCSGMNGWDDIPTLRQVEKFLKERP
ncbi:MAG: carbohydrate kinase family protein [Candidatus Lindowbacteria bacterium]|nr:carbohydrate kinase family protein [Candidatus Lindowbacteria bacterium]